MEKNKKTILPLLLVALFSVFVIFLIILTKSKETKTGAPEIVQNNSETKNPEIFFASNGKNTVYKIKKDDKWSVIWNGSEGKEYDFVSNPVFSSDGSQIAYNAELDGQAYVVVNNTQEINAYIKANYITFSEDGKTIAFVSTKGTNSYVVISATVGGTSVNESEEYEQIGIAESADGNSTAIIMNNDGSKIAYVVVENGKAYVVVNGQKSQGYDEVLNFSFSDDGSDFTYQAQSGDAVLTIVNNQVISSTGSNSSSSNQSSSNSNNNSSNNSSSSNSSSNNYPSSTYRYKISTKKDIVRDKDQLDYSTCESSGTCNF